MPGFHVATSGSTSIRVLSAHREKEMDKGCPAEDRRSGSPRLASPHPTAESPTSTTRPSPLVGTAPAAEQDDAAAEAMEADIPLSARRWFAGFDDPAAVRGSWPRAARASKSARSSARIPDEISLPLAEDTAVSPPLRRLVKQMRGTMLWLSRRTCGSCGSAQSVSHPTGLARAKRPVAPYFGCEN